MWVWDLHQCTAPREHVNLETWTLFDCHVCDWVRVLCFDQCQRKVVGGDVTFEGISDLDMHDKSLKCFGATSSSLGSTPSYFLIIVFHWLSGGHPDNPAKQWFATSNTLWLRDCSLFPMPAGFPSIPSISINMQRSMFWFGLLNMLGLKKKSEI